MPAAAATRRTTAPKPNVVNFDEARKAAKKGKRKPALKPLVAFGREWTLHRPNIALVGDLIDSDRVAALGLMIAASVVKSERDEFLAAMMGEEDFDEEDLLKLAEIVNEAVFEGIPT